MATPNGRRHASTRAAPSVTIRALEPDLWFEERPGASPFPPIADYGFLSDCECTALVASSGNVEWMCLPRMDSPSVFGAILDRGAGGFRFGPADVTVPAARRYLPGTMVLETSWGAQRRLDHRARRAADRPVAPRHAISRPHRRAPTDYEAEHVLLRTVRCVNGEVQLVLDCEPAFDYGRHRARWQYTEHGYHQGIAVADGIDLQLKLTTDMRLGFEGAELARAPSSKKASHASARCRGATTTRR